MPEQIAFYDYLRKDGKRGVAATHFPAEILVVIPLPAATDPKRLFYNEHSGRLFVDTDNGSAEYLIEATPSGYRGQRIYQKLAWGFTPPAPPQTTQPAP